MIPSRALRIPAIEEPAPRNRPVTSTEPLSDEEADALLLAPKAADKTVVIATGGDTALYEGEDGVGVGTGHDVLPTKLAADEPALIFDKAANERLIAVVDAFVARKNQIDTAPGGHGGC